MKKGLIKDLLQYLRENPDERALILSDICILVAFFFVATAAIYLLVDFYGG